MMESKQHIKSILKEDFNIICRFCLQRRPLKKMFDLRFEEFNFIDIFNALFCTELNTDDHLPKNMCETCFDVIISFYKFKKKIKETDIILRSIASEDVNKSNLLHKPIICDVKFNLMDPITTINIETVGESEELLANCNEFEIMELNTDVKEEIMEEFKESDLQNENLEKVIYDCSCGKKFKSYSSYARHQKEYMRKKQSNSKISEANDHYTCDFCDRVFVQFNMFTIHNQVHNGIRPFVCEDCGAGFYTRQSLKYHLKVEHNKDLNGLGSYQCTICQKVFKFKKTLTKHLLIHRERDFLCSICGKTFYSKSILQNHYFTHANKKPFSCSYCDKSFRQKNCLEDHLHRHTKEKLYLCEICPRRFTQRNHLIKHIKNHNKSNYFCPHCTKTFTLKSDYRQHVYKTHPGETVK